MSETNVNDAQKQFQEARRKRDELWARYLASVAENDINADLWFDRWEEACARVERMKPY